MADYCYNRADFAFYLKSYLCNDIGNSKLWNGSIFLLNNLAVKTVDFMGNGLLTIKDSKGVIWTDVNSFCRGIGLNKNE